MSDSSTREAYRDRLEDDDIVYVVEGESVMGNDKLVVKKGTIHNSGGKRYPTLLLWPTLDGGPGVSGVTKSPREVFTGPEVLSLIEHYDPSLLATSGIIDEILADPIAGPEIVPILGGAAMYRLAEDELAFPGDPER